MDPSFNKDVLSSRYVRTSTDALESVGPKEIKLYMIYRVKVSPKRRWVRGFTNLRFSDST